MMRRLLLGSVVALCAHALFVPAADARTLNLREAIALARAHAPQLAGSQAQTAAAEALVQGAQGERFGTITLTSAVSYISKLSTLQLSLPGLPTISRTIGTHDSYQNDLRYALPLWTGGRIGAAIETAEHQRSAAQAQAGADTLKVIFQTHLDYFALAAANENLRLANVTLGRVRNLQTEVNNLHDAGLADSLALVDAAIAVNRALLQQEQATEARRRAELTMQIHCGLRVNDSLTLADSLTAPTVQPEPKELTERPELVAAQARIEAAASRIRQQQAEYFPTLTAVGGYSYGRPNVDRFGNSWNGDWTAGAQLNWSFGVGGKTANSINRARADWQLAKAEHDRLQEQLTTEQLLARERLQLAAASYTTQQERAGLRRDAFRLAQIQFREGTLSSTRLFDAEQLLGEAELSAALAIVEWYAARSAAWYAAAQPELSQGL